MNILEYLFLKEKGASLTSRERGAFEWLCVHDYAWYCRLLDKYYGIKS